MRSVARDRMRASIAPKVGGRSLSHPRLDQRGQLLLQSIDHGIGMDPGPTQALWVVMTEVGFHCDMAEEQRTLGQQQAHRVLHRVHVGDEIVGHDEVDQIDQVVESGPGGERQPRRAYLDPVLAKRARRPWMHRLRNDPCRGSRGLRRWSTRMPKR